MRDLLKSLYRENIKKIKNTYKTIEKSFPDSYSCLSALFLLSVPDSYVNSPVKLMIIGQQTNGWGYYIPEIIDSIETKIEYLMKHYEKFNFGEGYNYPPFFNVFHKIRKYLLSDESPWDCAMWGNINRFDQGGKRPDWDVTEIIKNLDFLLLRELEILKPDICIFLIGYTFDDRLKSIGIKLEPVPNWEEYQLCRLEHPALPKNSFRTYHPKYLRISNLEEKILEALKNLVKES